MIKSQDWDTSAHEGVTFASPWEKAVSILPELPDEALVRLAQEIQELLNERGFPTSSHNAVLTSTPTVEWPVTTFPSSSHNAASASNASELSIGASMACAKFLHDLPELCSDRQLNERWVLYVGNHRENVADTKRELIHQCNARGLASSDYFIGYVDDVAALDFEPGEIDVCDVQEFGTAEEAAV